MFKTSDNQMCAISMAEYGLRTTIMTNSREIDEVMQEYKLRPDHYWCGGLGKKYLYQSLKSSLQPKDLHFSRNPMLANPLNHEWTDFCDDCVLLFVLHAHLLGRPILLSHCSLKLNIHDAKERHVQVAHIDMSELHPEIEVN